MRVRSHKNALTPALLSSCQQYLSHILDIHTLTYPHASIQPPFTHHQLTIIAALPEPAAAVGSRSQGDLIRGAGQLTRRRGRHGRTRRLTRHVPKLAVADITPGQLLGKFLQISERLPFELAAAVVDAGDLGTAVGRRGVELLRVTPFEAVGVDELQAEVVRTLDGGAAHPGGGAQAELAAAVVELVADLVGGAVEDAVEAGIW